MSDAATVDEGQDFLGMSDEEIMNFDPSKVNAPAATVPEGASGEGGDEDTQDADNSGSEDAGTSNQADNADDGDDDSEEPENSLAAPDNADPHKDTAKTTEPAAQKKDEVTPEANKENKETPDAASIDYKAEYLRIVAPFKANGRDVEVASVDDAIALMQMGANYNKKMAALKPNLKMLKLLENNNLLSEEKLSFLIDLSNKNPNAINKLVQDSGIDPLDLSEEKAGEYKPKTYNVDDRELDLDTVLEEIQDTDTYTRTLDVVGNKWDGASKQTIADSPQVLKVINAHMQNGVYDIVSKEVENQRMFGRLKGLSDIEAYRQVGDAIQANGGFNHLAQSEKPAAAPKVVVPPPKQVPNPKLNEKRRAASSTKPSGSTSVSADFNPLNLSDEEFSKLSDKKLFKGN